MKTKHIIILSVVTLLLGFMLGRLSVMDESVVKTKEVVKKVPSPYIIRDTIFSPSPTLIHYSVKTDTLYLIQKVDTAKILADYFLSRQYKLDFSNDSVGQFIVEAEVSQNKLVSASSFIQPITKFIYKENTITKKTVRAFQPWVTIGTNAKFDAQQVTLGVDLNQRYVLGVSGFKLSDKYNYTMNVGIKF